MTELKVSDKVHYTSPHGSKENGMIKSFNESKSIAFVVYKCNNEWSNYKNYTGASTSILDLKYGWVDDKGNLLKEFCEHYYIPTNAKYQSATQVECQFCGDVIN